MTALVPISRRRAGIEAPLKAFINGILGDAYSTIKVACALALLSRVLKLCRSAWMYRAGGLPALQRYVLGKLAPLLKMVPMVRKQLDGEMSKLKADLEKDIQKDLTAPCARLPQRGQGQQALLELMKTRQQIDTQYWEPGKMTGAIYHGDLEYMAWVGEVYGMFAFTNPLHMKLHPATRQMESEVIAMVLGMYNGSPGCCGAFTTGGTESILMAMKSYRDWGKRTKGITHPNVVCCTTAHAAFDKAGEYFGIEIRKAGFINDEQEIDLQQVRRLVDGNTVALVGSACQYPTVSAKDPREDTPRPHGPHRPHQELPSSRSTRARTRARARAAL